MNWDFNEVDYNQKEMYEVLTRYWSVGKAPIFFAASNTSADYTASNWMDKCYERFNEIGGKYVVFWLVGEDMYCEAVVRGPTVINTPTYEQKYLFRVEFQRTWCPSS
uniref:Uncharacterized protein n=1 Tax=Caenorhabditis japonica TaxID=281687 RepID=A0A8R1EN36_CAEJA